MEFMKGIQRKETVELADLLSGDYTGKTVKKSLLLQETPTWENQP